MAFGNKAFRSMRLASCLPAGQAGVMRHAILLLFISVMVYHSVFAQPCKDPNVAGTFYPDDPGQLSGMIDEFLTQAAPKPLPAAPFALICPHAGYGYSGSVAAYAYKLIQNRAYSTVIVLAPSHQYAFEGISVYAQGSFRTPLGVIPVDEKFTSALLYRDKRIGEDPAAFAKEHALEVQLPFLQKTLVNFKLVPVVIGDVTLDTLKVFSALLAQTIGQRTDVLLIVSTDLYHGYDYEEAQVFDQSTITALKMMDGEAFYYALREGKIQACGGFPVVAALLTAKLLNHNILEVLRQTNSAAVTGHKKKGTWTVGYAAAAIDNPETKGAPIMFDKPQRKRLLDLARNTIKTYLSTGKKPDISENDPLLNKIMGAFVTLHKNGELRGCIGSIVGRQPLYLTIRDMAIAAAVDDPRFPALAAGELNDIDIEISVMSPLERVDSAEDIIMGIHGVVVVRGGRNGVYLPQVADQTGWSREEFLSSLCASKAGLPADSWKDPATELYVFTAEVFSEKDY